MAAEPIATPADIIPKVPRAKKAKYTYMLHDPDSMHALGKYVATDYRYAALKVVSRWYKKGLRRFLLRKTNTKEIREYEGSLVTLPTPKVIKRAGAVEPIVYHHKPEVTFLKAWVYGEDPPADETDVTPK